MARNLRNKNSSTAAILLLGARQVLTMVGPRAPRRRRQMSALSIIEDGAVLVRDGRIDALGRTGDLRRRAGTAQVLDCSGKVVLPAFIDSHTHAAFASPRLTDYEMRLAGRSYEQIARAGGGIHSSVEHCRACTPAAMRRQIATAAATALRYGTGTMEVKSGYGLSVEAELMLLEAVRDAAQDTAAELVPTLLGAHVTPRGLDPREYLRVVIEEMIPRVAERRLAEFCDVFCDRGAFTVSEARRVLEAGVRHGLRPKLHAEQLSRSGAALMAMEVGAVSVDHLERAGSREITALARSKTIATLLPGATFHLGRQDYAPARALIDGGAAVALATDFNPGTSPTLNMQLMLSLACTQMRMTPAEAITAATFNAAYALNRAHRLGTLAPGMQADIAVFAVSDYREIPYFFGMNHCSFIIKKGTLVAS